MVSCLQGCTRIKSCCTTKCSVCLLQNHCQMRVKAANIGMTDDQQQQQTVAVSRSRVALCCQQTSGTATRQVDVALQTEQKDSRLYIPAWETTRNGHQSFRSSTESDATVD